MIYPPQPVSRLLARIGVGVLRSDLAAASNGGNAATPYIGYLNDALKEIQDMRSWTCMKKDGVVTIAQGLKSVSMPGDFKELQPKIEGSPVNFILQDPNNPGALFSVPVIFEQQAIRKLFLFAGMGTYYGVRLQVFLKRDSTGVILGIEQPAFQDLNFRVSYMAYLPPVLLPTDTNPISDAWPAMVIAKAKALAFSDINDPASRDLEMVAVLKFKQASIEDSRADLVGRDFHM